jgi:hypothetical protein
MFGSPDWFRPKTIGWGLTPVRWQGWAYALAWAGVICAPFVLFLMREQVVESLAWLTVTMGGLVYDVRDILRRMQRAALSGAGAETATAAAKPKDDVFYIGDSAPGASVATRNYSLKLK